MGAESVATNGRTERETKTDRNIISVDVDERVQDLERGGKSIVLGYGKRETERCYV